MRCGFLVQAMKESSASLFRPKQNEKIRANAKLHEMIQEILHDIFRLLPIKRNFNVSIL